MITLSPRLAAVSTQVLPEMPMADIGTDHAYLPVHLIQRGSVPRAVAADVLPGPLDAARATVKVAGLEREIDLRLGNGLQVLQPGEVATATICGMGGPLIASILAAGPLAGLRRLVLQPMGGEARLRQWLAANGWRLVAEELVAEAGRIYVILAAEPGAMALDDADILVGPILRRDHGPLLRPYIMGIREQMERALEGARRSHRPEAQRRADELEQRLAILKEVAGNGDDR